MSKNGKKSVAKKVTDTFGNIFQKGVRHLFMSMVFVGAVSLAGAEPVAELGTIVVASSRIGEYADAITGNVTIVTKADIEKSNAQTVGDVLKNALGVYVYDKNTVRTTSVDMRGFGDTASRNVLVLINDRKINTVDMAGPDLSQIPIGAIERIEIVRGAASVLYGDNAVGGVINIITKKGAGSLVGRTGAFYGSYDARGTDAEVSGAHKNISYYFYSKYFDQRGYRENSDVLTKDFMSRVGYDFTERIKADLTIGRHHDTSGMPGGLDESELASLGRRDSANQGDLADTKDRYVQLTFDVDPWPVAYDWGNFVVDLTYRDRDVFDSFSGWNTNRDIQTTGVTGKYIFNKPLFNREVHFVTGIDYYDTENGIVGSGSNTDDLVISKSEFGLYSFLEWELITRLFANAGGRYQRAEYTFNNKDGSAAIKKSPDEWVSIGGLKHEYAPGSNVSASVQQTFRFLTTDEWYSTWSGLNTNLEQQTGMQYEFGVRHSFRDRIVLHVTPYCVDTKNEIFYDPNFGWGANSNYDKTRRLGLEVGSTIDVKKIWGIERLDMLEFQSNYTYQKPQFRDGSYDGKDIPLVPRNQANVAVTVGFWKGYQVSVSSRYVGSRFIINDLDNVMPRAKPYVTSDAKVSFRRDTFEVYLAVNNILDARYSPYQIKKTASTRDYFPAPERNFLVGVNIRF